MKECKILQFADFDETVLEEDKKSDATVDEYPEIEKFLEKYLNDGFVVKHMMGEGGDYSFYLERDV